MCSSSCLMFLKPFTFSENNPVLYNKFKFIKDRNKKSPVVVELLPHIVNIKLTRVFSIKYCTSNYWT